MTWLDDKIDAWHNSPDGSGELHEWLGMSEELYKRWIEKPPVLMLGMDEVGYGALAGPLVIGGVLAPVDWSHELLKDSKAFKGNDGRAERARAAVLSKLGSPATFFLHRTPAEDIDKVGVWKARLQAFRELAERIMHVHKNVLVVIDGDDRVEGLEHICLPKADTFVPHVMAASIVAKVSRDTEMRLHDKDYPKYGFGQHKGYGTKYHEAAILKHGLCPLHRRSYKMKFLKGSGSSLPSQ